MNLIQSATNMPPMVKAQLAIIDLFEELLNQLLLKATIALLEDMMLA